MLRVLQNQLLGGGFGFAVKMQRIGGGGFNVISRAPVKYQIRGKENERNFRRQFREPLRHFHVHAPGKSGIILRFRNAGNRGAMDDKFWLVFLKLAADGGEIKQVKLLARQCAHAPARGNMAQDRQQRKAEVAPNGQRRCDRSKVDTTLERSNDREAQVEVFRRVLHDIVCIAKTTMRREDEIYISVCGKNQCAASSIIPGYLTATERPFIWLALVNGLS